HQLDILVSGEVNINHIQKIRQDIGLPNIMMLSFLRVINGLPTDVRDRINRKLLFGFNDNLKLLDIGSRAVVNKFSEEDDFEDAEFEEVSEEKTIEDIKEEEPKPDKSSALKKL